MITLNYNKHYLFNFTIFLWSIK